MLVGNWLPSKKVAKEGEHEDRYEGKEGSHGKRFVQKKSFESLSLIPSFHKNKRSR